MIILACAGCSGGLISAQMLIITTGNTGRWIMIPKIEPQADAQYIYVKKEAFYKGNFISLMCESFFFAFALTMFSPENVLPVYVSSLSDKAIYIALISALYYGISYSATVFSCVVGVNARSPKWISVVICFLQRKLLRHLQNP